MKVFVRIILIASLISVPSLSHSYEISNPVGYWEQGYQFRYDILIKEFRSYANFFVASRGFKFGSGVQDMFDNNLAAMAAAELVKEDPPRFERNRDEIRRSIRKIIDRMIIESENIPGYSAKNPRTVGEDTFASAMAFVCPLWPFCS